MQHAACYGDELARPTWANYRNVTCPAVQPRAQTSITAFVRERPYPWYDGPRGNRKGFLSSDNPGKSSRLVPSSHSLLFVLQGNQKYRHTQSPSHKRQPRPNTEIP